MNRRLSKRLWVLVMSLLLSAWGCTTRGTLVDPTEGGRVFDKGSFWESLPRPDDAEVVEVGEGFDLGFVTRTIEPELFDFYATWLREQGWQQQAPTVAMITLPHQTWRKDGVELLIELQGLDEQGRTVVWLRAEALEE